MWKEAWPGPGNGRHHFRSLACVGCSSTLRSHLTIWGARTSPYPDRELLGNVATVSSDDMFQISLKEIMVVS